MKRGPAARCWSGAGGAREGGAALSPAGLCSPSAFRGGSGSRCAGLWCTKSLHPLPDPSSPGSQLYQVLRTRLLQSTLPELTKPLYDSSPPENIQICIWPLAMLWTPKEDPTDALSSRQGSRPPGRPPCLSVPSSDPHASNVIILLVPQFFSINWFANYIINTHKINKNRV